MGISMVGTGIIFIALLLCWFSLFLVNRKELFNRFYFRKKDRDLRLLMSNSLEESTPIHLDIGGTGGSEMISASAITAMRLTEVVSAQMAYSDEPWKITCNSGSATVFEKETVRKGLDIADYGNEFDSETAVFCGYSPLSHQTGMIALMDETPTALHLNIGAFGAEIALQDLAFKGDESVYIAGENPVSQAVGFVTADEIYIGEQVFELPDSISEEAKTDFRLLSMDLLRFGAIAAIVIGVILGMIR